MRYTYPMKIKWNEYTWYSKLAAVIFFLAIFPIWTFYLGTQYQKTVDALEAAPVPIVAQHRETDKHYVGDVEQCKLIKYLCVQGQTSFSDAKGCGCQTVR